MSTDNVTNSIHRHALPAGYDLLWYQVKEVLGQGAFGITYLCVDMNLRREVAIKEYLPGALSMRDDDQTVQPISSMQIQEYKAGLQRFLTEARTLVRFEHPNIVRVLNVFEANNSAYMVMAYERGESLKEILARRRTLPQAELDAMAIPVMNGLIRIHAAGFIHRDIKPGNVFIRSADASPVLLDFGSAREAMTEEVRTLTNFVSPGYAPIEQYTGKSDKQGPWTDIYGLGATLYKAVTGRLPMDAVERSEGIVQDDHDSLESTREFAHSGYSDVFLQAIDHALAFRSVDRPQTVVAWMREFGFISEVDTLPVAPIRQTLKGEAVATDADAQETLLNIAGETATVELQNPADSLPEVRFAGGRGGWLLPLVIGVVLLVLGITLFLKPWMTPDDGLPVPNVQGVTAVPDGADDKPHELTDTLTPEAGTQARIPTGESEVNSRPDMIHELLQLAEDDLKALRLTTPPGNNALEHYRQVLKLEADNSDAVFGLKRIAAVYRSLARHAIDKGELQRAAVYLDKSRDLNATHPQQAELEQGLEAHRQASASMDPKQNSGLDTLKDKASDLLDADSPADKPPISRGDEIKQRFGGH